MSDEKFLPSSYGLETTEATLAHYEAWAGSYDAEIGEENRYAQPGRCTRALLASGIGPDARILDVGCGSGLSGVALVRGGYALIDGCDLSPSMLALAAETGAEDNNVSLFHALSLPVAGKFTPAYIRDVQYIQGGGAELID